MEVRIETGRTHQIRVHMQAMGHPVVGDFLYGAPHRIKPEAVGRGPKARPAAESGEDDGLSLERNFLHAAELEFAHPRTGEELALKAELPAELGSCWSCFRGRSGNARTGAGDDHLVRWRYEPF